MRIQLYDNKKPQKSVFAITTDGRKLVSIQRICHFPLFQEYDVVNLTYPSRQQLHSQRYYIQHHCQFKAELTDPTLVLNTAKQILNLEMNYDCQINK